MRKFRSLFLSAANLCCAVAVYAAPAMSSATNNLPVNGYSVGFSSSSSLNNTALSQTAVEADVAKSTSANNTLWAGLMSIWSFPAPVTNLSAVAYSTNSTKLTWSAPGYDGEFGALQTGTSYYIQFASATPISWAFSSSQIVISTKNVNPSDSQTIISTGLFANTTYYFSLWTLDAQGDLSPLSDQTTAATLARPPPTLTKTFLMVGASSVTVDWAALPNAPPAASSTSAEGYELDASTAPDFSGSVISSVTASVAQSTLTVYSPALNGDTLYYFRAGSLNWAGVANYTQLGSTQTLLEALPPSLSNPVFTAISTYAITANWSANGNAPETLYTLQSSTASNFTGSVASTQTFNLFASSSSLNANTTYYFEVKATTGASSSAYTLLGGTATLAAVPSQAVSSWANIGISSISVLWLPNSNPLNVTTYTVVLSTGSNYPNSDSGNVSLSTAPSGSTESATILGLTPNTTYFLFADAVNWNNVASSYAALGSTSTLTAAPSSAASTFSAVLTGGFAASWNANGNPVSATTYTVEISTDPGFSSGLSPPYDVSIATEPGSPAASFTSLNANTTYYFRVEAVNNGGVASAWTNLGSTSTLALAPSSLTFSVAPPTVSQIRLDWSGGSNGPGTLYTVGIATTPTFNPPHVTTQTVFATDVSTQGLAPNTTYYFQAYATNNNGIVSSTTFDSTSTLAALPLSAASTFTAVSTDGFSVSWNAGGNPISLTSYTVEVSTDSGFSSGLSSPYDVSLTTFPGAPSAIFSTLNSNTTYFFRVQAINNNGIATNWADLGSTVTLAQPPGSPFPSTIYLSSAVISWTPTTSQGYAINASSTNFSSIAPGGKVYFSSTTNSNAASLAASGLDANTTYYFTAGAYNWNQTLNAVSAGSTATLAVSAVSPHIYAVYAASATLNWNLPPATPQSASVEGYELDAATADSSGFSDFTGDIASSVTFMGVQIATLTVQNLTPGTTYAFRVGSLNWNQVPNFIAAGSTFTSIVPLVWVGGHDNNWYTKTNWNPASIPGPYNPVTINISTSVQVDASSPSIKFDTLYLGGVTGAFAANLMLSTAIASGGSIIIYPNSGLTVNTSAQLNLNGSFTMEPGSSMTHTLNTGTGASSPINADINLNVGQTFDLMTGATVTASGLGFAGGQTASNGNGPGLGSAAPGNGHSGGGGGGHGGPGGTGIGNNANGGGTYDLSASTQPGSGGGGASGATGGNGGGLVVITASSMSIDGQIDANGSAGAGTTYGGGGGSGGSINLTAHNFDGSGVLLSTGGAQGGASTNLGGEGGGGLIYINITQSGVACNLNYSVAGGSGTNLGNFTSNSSLETPTSFTGTSPSSFSITWQWTSVPYASNYQIFYSTPSGQVLSSSLFGSSISSDVMTGLQANTTYTAYVQASGCGATSNSTSYVLSTLTSPPTTTSPSFLTVSTGMITAQWLASPSSPSSSAAEGYELDASTAPDFSGNLISSITNSGTQSSLSEIGLNPNSTYYFRVAGLNWVGTVGSYTTIGSTPTLANAPQTLAQTYLEVYFTSATLNWAALPAVPPAASSISAEGYELDDSTYSDFSKSVVSSITLSVAQSTLSFSNLTLATTNYFRVGALNWAHVPNYTTLSPLDIAVSTSVWPVAISLDASVAASTISASSVTIYNTGNISTTLIIYGATMTVGSPWILSISSGIERPVLQGLFNSSMPSSAQFATAITTAPVNSGASAYGSSGQSIPAGSSVTMWFQFWRAVSSAVDSSSPQSINVYFQPVYP